MGPAPWGASADAMSGVDLCVQRLRLQAPRDGSATALRSRVEDALRIASMPAALAHRFVLVRRLRLQLPRGASAQSLALQLEREWRALESLAQPMDQAAHDAGAVWAADEVQARMLLLGRWLASRNSAAWYWQRLLPTVPAAMPLAQRLRALLFAPFDTAPAADAAAGAQRARLWQQATPRIEAAGQMPAVLATLSPAESELLLAAAPAWRGAVLPAVAPWFAGRSASPPSPTGTLLHRQAPPEGAIPLADAGVAPAQAETLDRRSGPQARRPSLPADARSAAAAGFEAGVAVCEAAAVAAAASPPASARTQPAMAAPIALDEARETAWAGLWFLLPMLLRQGLSQHPATATLLAAVLQRAAARHGLDDPARDWIEQVAALATADEAGAAHMQDEAAAWWLLARRLSLRQARLPLRRVLHRPGRVWLAPHRVDLVLPLHSADVRIRRAGFDIDPGYVPWLDAVIHFHYL